MTTAKCAPDLERDFRDAMASLASTACVVTARDRTRRLGRTVTAAFSLSVAPATILVSISESSELAAAIRARGSFSMAMLSELQAPVADAFAGKLQPEDRFGVGSWRDWASGNPRLCGAVAAMDCTVAQEMAVQDHLLFAGTVRELDLEYELNPLVWHRRRYSAVSPL